MNLQVLMDSGNKKRGHIVQTFITVSKSYISQRVVLMTNHVMSAITIICYCIMTTHDHYKYENNNVICRSHRILFTIYNVNDETILFLSVFSSVMSQWVESACVCRGACVCVRAFGGGASVHITGLSSPVFIEYCQ
jgi:hypothetical protein